MTEYSGDAGPRVDLTKPRQASAPPNVPIAPPPPAPRGGGPSGGPSLPRRGPLLIAGLLALLLVGGISAAFVLTRDTDASTTTSESPEGTNEATSSEDDDPQSEPSSSTTDGENEQVEAENSEDDALNQLTSIAGTDEAAAAELDGIWTAQLSSSAAGDSPIDVLAKYQDLKSRYVDALLVWSGDWPGSVGPSSLQSCVVVSGESYDWTRPLLEWCASEGWSDGQCWAKRLARSGDDPLVNTDRAPADDRNN